MLNDETSRLEREQAETRINVLVKCLDKLESLKTKTDYVSMKKFKEKLNETFENVHLQLNLLESKANTCLDESLVHEKPVDIVSIRIIEQEIRHLIVRLSSMSMLNKQQKLLILSTADASIKPILTKINELDQYLKQHEASLHGKAIRETNENLIHFLDNIRQSLAEEENSLLISRSTSSDLSDKSNLATSTETIKSMEITEKNDINKWLLSSSSSNPSCVQNQPNQNCSNSSTPLENEQNHFDFVDFESELDSIEVITDFEEFNNNYEYWLLDSYADKASSKQANRHYHHQHHQNNQTKYPYHLSKHQPIVGLPELPNDGFSHTFEAINNKPLDYWLLK